MAGVGASTVSYMEFHGNFDPPPQRPAGSDVVVLSNLRKGAALSAPRPGVCIRYVGRGMENYRISGRSFRLKDAQVMIAPQADGAEVEVPAADRDGTAGLCVLLRQEEGEEPWVAGPMLLSAGTTALGPIMEQHLKALWKPSPDKSSIAAESVRQLKAALPSVAAAVLEQAAAMDAVKPSTRFELVRRASLGRAYLHSVVDRAVDLEELAGAVGASKFQLLRAFQGCFGESPAAYHRRLRLTLAMEELKRRDITLSVASEAFGFADGSSFSHAYRRAFGRAPVWSKLR